MATVYFPFAFLSSVCVAFSNCPGHRLWISSTSSTLLSATITCWVTRETCAVFSNFQVLTEQKWLLLGGTKKNWITNIKSYTPSHFSKVYKIEILQPVYQQVAVKLGQVWCLSLSHLLFLLAYLLICLFVCFLFAFFLFVIWFVVSPPLPRQGQEYAALGALVNDDEPLSSPPGSTEMELKVKQVCPDTVTCWELVENDSWNLVRSDTKASMLSEHNRPSPNLAPTMTAIMC